MEKINKLSLPVVILIASIILAGSYYFVETNKQKSIERQEQNKITEENRVKSVETFQKSMCSDDAEASAIALNKASCDRGDYCVKGNGGYLVTQYDNYYSICLQSKGLK